MDMDFRLHNRNFHMNLDQEWRNSNISLPSFLPDANIPRTIFPIHFPRFNQNARQQPFYVRNQRMRPRRRPNVNEMRNSLRRIRHEMYEAYGDLEDARDDFEENKTRLDEAKNEVIQTKNNLQTAIIRLDRTMSEFNSPRVLNSLTLRDRSSFQQDIEDARQDIEEARARMRDTENDLSENDQSRLQQQNVNIQPNPLITGVKRSRPDDNSQLDLNGNTTNNDNNDKFPDGSSCCSICMENPVNSVLYMCGHMCICYGCAMKLLRRRGDTQRCPMCRAVIRDVIKIYRS